MSKVKILGSYLSPYARKVLVTLQIKGIAYEIDPLIPFFGNQNFDKVSILRTIPVLFEGDLILNDSSVIIQYLEEKYPSPSILPKDLKDRAKTRFIEEYFDTYGGNVIIWGLYTEKRIKPFLFKKESDQNRIEKAINVEIPGILEFVEKQMKESPNIFFGETLSLAEISIGSFMRNAILSGYKVDKEKFPLVSKLLDRIYSHQSFASLKKYEDILMKTPPKNYIKVLKESGAPVVETSIYTGESLIKGKLSKI